MAIRTILVPTDFSNDAQAALDQATEFARLLSARLVLVHSYWLGVSTSPTGAGVAPADFVEHLRGRALAELEKVAKRVSEAGVPCEARVSGSSPVAAILELEGALPADLIVLGTRGLTGLKHLLVGSVAERIVRLARVPVVTVKARV